MRFADLTTEYLPEIRSRVAFLQRYGPLQIEWVDESGNSEPGSGDNFNCTVHVGSVYDLFNGPRSLPGHTEIDTSAGRDFAFSVFHATYPRDRCQHIVKKAVDNVVDKCANHLI